MRQHRSLAGTWQFQLDPEGGLSVETLAPDREITVPMPWQAALPELERYSGYAWYQREVELDDAWLGGEVLLHFGAVDYWCQVFVNGQLAGQHEGGYTPFELPIRQYVQAGANTVAVRVYDTVQREIVLPRWPEFGPESANGQPPFDARNIPHGKQEWYINVGGIWQDVTLRAVPRTWIDQVHVTPDIHTGTATVAVELGGSLDDLSGTLRVAIGDAGSAEAALVSGQRSYTADVQVSEPHLWDVDDPFLYTVTATLEPAGDELSARFGFREITTRDGQFLLNGQPLFLISALDQDLYPDTIYTVPSEEFLRDQFQKAKHLGFNNLRCHIKPPDPLYLQIADEVGMTIWAEIPSWRTFPYKGSVHANETLLDDTIKARVDQTLVEMIRRDFNHPALIIWTIVNEDWGTMTALSGDDRAWLAQMYDRCKQLDPTRLVVDNSACFNGWGPNLHVKSDIDDFHHYTNIPDSADSWEGVIEQFSLRPLWTYSGNGDTQRTGREPLVLSEFGNWGLPSLKALRDHYNGDPGWFKLGPWWSAWDGEPGWPAGVAERFAELGLDKVWPDYEQFATATQWHQFNAMKWEIEVMRRQPGLSGYVITELSDIYWESNGVLDFVRNPKAYHDVFGTVNTPDVIVPQIERYAWWDDERPSVRIHLSHYGAASWEGATFRWTIGGSSGEGSWPVGAIARGSVVELGMMSWSWDAVDAAQVQRAEFVVEGANGAELARNTLELLVLPRGTRQGTLGDALAVVTGPAAPHLQGDGVAVTPPPSPLTQALEGAGYTIAPLGAETRLAVSTRPTAELLQWVRDGGSLLYVVTGVSPFFWVQGRGGTYSGNWMSNWSWLKPETSPRLSVANPLSLPFRSVMPQGTIVGLPYADATAQQDYLAGLIGGWVNHPAVHTVQFRYGAGRVLMTTFNLADKIGADPVATALFHDLVEHLASDRCQPTITANF